MTTKRRHSHKAKSGGIMSFLSAHRLKASFASLAAGVALLANAGIIDIGKLPPWAKALIPTTVTASAPTPTVTPASLEEMAKLAWPTPQAKFATYESARKALWAQLYPSGGTELYCGVKFASDQSNAINEKLSVEHAYPADEISNHYPQCTDRNCKNPAAERAMADLNNLWPAVLRVNESRGKARYGEVANAGSAFGVCLDRNAGADPIVEPRTDVRGDVARSVVYMHFVYGLPIEKAATDADTLVAWMKLDPPDAIEVARNARIVEMQGAGNPLVTANAPGT